MDATYRTMFEGEDELARASSTTEVMLKLARLMKRVFKCRLALSYLLEEQGGRLVPAGCSGLTAGSVPVFLGHPLPLKSLPLLKKMIERRRRVLLTRFIPPGLLPPVVVELFPHCAVLALPMEVRGQVVGCAFALRERPFDVRETALLDWAVSHAALAVHSNSMGNCPASGGGELEADGLRVCEAARSMFVNTVASLVNAIEAKSPWTKGHSERVMRTSAIIAAAMGLSEGEVERVRLGGLLHDIGKIGVEVVNYPGRLGPESGPQMRLHPEMGVAILAPIQELKLVLPGVLHHHERFDGKGYPAKLSGQEIPLDARIIAVADAFDAIASERPYKSGTGRDGALAELEACAGSQFDPELVRCLSHFIREEGKEALPLAGKAPLDFSPPVFAPGS
jgi:HD-GYP domain-containing protein (c-di-GMP phosphodiesterase class II)